MCELNNEMKKFRMGFGDGFMEGPIDGDGGRPFVACINVLANGWFEDHATCLADEVRSYDMILNL